MEQILRNIIIILKIVWSLIVSLIEWLIPRSLYAKPVDQDVVLITGAGSGLGRALALRFAELGSQLVLWDVNLKGLEETRNSILKLYSSNCALQKKDCLIYKVDVSDKEQVKMYAEIVHRDLNKDNTQEDEKYVSILINNAGIYHGLFLDELKDEQIERIFRINILAHFWTVRAFLPRMIQRERGHIVEIASMGGLFGQHKQVDYCATKYATVGFEESLSMELSYLGLSDKIMTTVVCPFFFRSNLFTGFNDKAALIMNVDYVAEETVKTIRCNHARILLPQFFSYVLYFFKSITPRRTGILLSRGSGIDDGIMTIKGAAALAPTKED